MSESKSSSRLFQGLDNHNYATWAFKMKSLLTEEKCWEAIDQRHERKSSERIEFHRFVRRRQPTCSFEIGKNEQRSLGYAQKLQFANVVIAKNPRSTKAFPHDSE